MSHPDDEFHPPTNDDPFWSETAWFAFSVPERKLAGWTYPFFRPTRTCARPRCSCGTTRATRRGTAGTTSSSGTSRARRPAQRLPSCRTVWRTQVREPQRVYDLRYRDPDADDIAFDLTFTAVMDPLSTKTSGPNGGHLDQLGRFTGTLVLDGETIEVDSYGARDRSWGSRNPFGPYLMSSGDCTATQMPYSHATSDTVSFQAITANVTDDYPMIMGFFLRDGEVSRLTKGRRAILARDPATDTVTRVLVEGTDELGREFHAEGETRQPVRELLQREPGRLELPRALGHRRRRGVGRAARELQHRRVQEVPAGRAACLTAADGSAKNSLRRLEVARQPLEFGARARRGAHPLELHRPVHGALVDLQEVGRDRRHPRGHRQRLALRARRRGTRGWPCRCGPPPRPTIASPVSISSIAARIPTQPRVELEVGRAEHAHDRIAELRVVGDVHEVAGGHRARCRRPWRSRAPAR